MQLLQLSTGTQANLPNPTPTKNGGDRESGNLFGAIMAKVNASQSATDGETPILTPEQLAAAVTKLTATDSLPVTTAQLSEADLETLAASVAADLQLGLEASAEQTIDGAPISALTAESIALAQTQAQALTQAAVSNTAAAQAGTDKMATLAADLNKVVAADAKSLDQASIATAAKVAETASPALPAASALATAINTSATPKSANPLSGAAKQDAITAITTAITGGSPEALAAAPKAATSVNAIVTAMDNITATDTQALNAGTPSVISNTIASADSIQANLSVSAPQSGAINAPAQAQQPLTASTMIMNSQIATQEWKDELGQNMVKLARGGDQRVSMHLNPTELGPMTVDMKVVEKQVQIQFLSHNGQVRTALENALPQLRDALAEQGMDLAESSVGQQRQNEERQANRGNADGTNGSDDTLSEAVTVSVSDTGALNSGGVDIFV